MPIEPARTSDGVQTLSVRQASFLGQAFAAAVPNAKRAPHTMSRCPGSLPVVSAVKDMADHKVDDEKSVYHAGDRTISLATMRHEAIDGSKGKNQCSLTLPAQTFVVTADVPEPSGTPPAGPHVMGTEGQSNDPGKHVNLDGKRSCWNVKLAGQRSNWKGAAGPRTTAVGGPGRPPPGACSLERGVAARHPGAYSWCCQAHLRVSTDPKFGCAVLGVRVAA